MSIKKIAVIQDLSCYGRASLTVTTPILSSMGFQVCPLPTAILSAHSEYPNYHMTDMTATLPAIISHWQQMELKFDAIYSGYMASIQQIEIVSDFFDQFRTPKNFILVDPVMGDNNELYPGLDEDIVIGMRKLCSKADIITPNLTEAALLLDEKLEDISLTKTIKWCKQLAQLGPKWVVITSAPSKDPRQAATIAYDANDQRFWRVMCDYIPASYPGTGDAFAAALAGSILRGDGLPVALDRAVHFINMGIKSTFSTSHNPIDGMEQERVLHILNEQLPYLKYELLNEEYIENL